jgi:hypothetical protein
MHSVPLSCKILNNGPYAKYLLKTIKCGSFIDDAITGNILAQLNILQINN